VESELERLAKEVERAELEWETRTHMEIIAKCVFEKAEVDVQMFPRSGFMRFKLAVADEVYLLARQCTTKAHGIFHDAKRRYDSEKRRQERVSPLIAGVMERLGKGA
jgi:hypothetical protein